jgi:putative peptidoglycan lipid II flippase
MFGTIGLYVLLPGDISLDPVRMGDAKLLVLGIGTTLGVVVQALVLIPALRKIGFKFRWRFGWDPRLSVFGGLAFWLVLYTVVSQIGYVVLTRVATGAAEGTMSIYSNSWLLLQVPYGVLGVSLLTAIMPRMSRAAADGDIPAVVRDLSLGSRMSVVMLLPICALITVLGPEIGDALFSAGRGGSGSTVLGLTLTTSAFGLVCYAITMLQLRVFYAMHDARTPTLINGVIVLAKLPLFLLCTTLLDPQLVVYGLTFVNAFGFLVGVIVGEVWLRIRLGRLDTVRVLKTVAKVGIAAIWGAAAALLIAKGVHALLPDSKAGSAWTALAVGGGVGLVLTFGVMTLIRVEELRPVTARITRLVRRG